MGNAAEGCNTVVMNSGDNEIRRRLLLAREAAKFTQVEVAKEMKVSRQTVSRWESGHSSPTLEQFADLCVLYGVTCYYVLRGTAESAGCIYNRVVRAESAPQTGAEAG